MEKLLNNLKPILIYWSAVLVNIAAYFMSDFDYITPFNRNQLAQLFCYFSLAFFCVLFGRFSDLKESKIGLIIVAVQLCLSGVIGIFNISLPVNITAYFNYVMYGAGYDAPFDALFNYDESRLRYFLNFLFSIIFPAVMILIGYTIKRLRKK